jgi:integrase
MRRSAHHCSLGLGSLNELLHEIAMRLEPITLSLEHRYGVAAVILIFAGIDAMANGGGPERSERDVDMSPIVRQIMKSVPWSEGLVFSPDGRQAIGEGSWIKRQWRKAQVAAQVRPPIRWYDLRHQYVSLLIAAGKSAKYIAEQAGHSSAGFTLDTYGHLFETIKLVPVEWPEDPLWPGGLEGHLAALQRPQAPSTADRTQ